MHPTLAEDRARLAELLQSVHGLASRELAGLDDRPAWQPRLAPVPEPLPAEGSGAQGALARFAEQWAPGFSGSAGPRYLGFVTGGATPASIAADWLTSVYDQNAGGGGGSSAAALERQTLTWLRELFGLGAAHSGAFVTGSTMSNTVGLAVAREWLGEQRNVSVSEDGTAALGPVTVLSGAPHSSIGKAASVLGFGRAAVRRTPLLPGNREAVDVAALARELEGLDGRPAIVVANLGTVDTVDFDDLRAIAALKDRYGFWLHADAAFGAFAALLPSHAHLTDGLDAADSVCVDLHKWLNVPYDSAVVFTRRQDLQARVFHNSSPYLGLPALPDPDFLHLTPENSRRLRALTAWFSLVAYGRDGHREIVARNTALAVGLGDALAEVPHLRLLAPVRLNVVCFTLAGSPTPQAVQAAVQAVAATGEAFVTPTSYRGVPALRAAFSNWRTTRADMERALAAITEATAPKM
ncbi:aspartate aminotransferase family protein [Streptomyces fagopyri]|uniref:Aspartate aminotransferase family protein n=1 Tax=Streptomyces fagopyri TaxID=2662397 RepID=A0A5Q0LPI7_9ACTN|nr:pyridoxal-dependent decarboxylase [Streptomyces fagopyri]QFZ78307.1 aspartate aminotransferase family protein [Streptomyces fagopyri]